MVCVVVRVVVRVAVRVTVEVEPELLPELSCLIEAGVASATFAGFFRANATQAGLWAIGEPDNVALGVRE